MLNNSNHFSVQGTKSIAVSRLTNDQIAARLDTRREVVCFWRKRFFAERLAGLEERARPGRPRTFSP
jgi:transposase